jgi:hypothetical protein
LWWEGFPVICALCQVHSFYPFPHFTMAPPQYLVYDFSRRMQASYQ